MTGRSTLRQDDATRLQRDAEALHAAVSELVRLYQFRDRDRICCHDISVTQCHALETLVEQGPLRLGVLAERLFLDKSTTSRVVRALIRKGYVGRTADRRDRRAVALAVTRAGRALCDRINADLVAQQRDLLAGFDSAVRAGVIDVIRRLATAADERFRAGAPATACAAGCAREPAEVR